MRIMSLLRKRFRAMYNFTEFPSGSVMCAARQGAGSVVVVCADPHLTPLERADKARQQVDEILKRLKENAP
jgi:hypothetical protein